ncbi:MAG: class I SAM-dependent methyltransferase [Thermoguttaceae bacterium]|nr:class I SAM-dependent methyltransferase [Thermoguttaceae bacterium]
MNERIEDAPTWLYDEFQHAGVDYANLEVARKYESRHLKFRDFEAEFERIRERADLKRSDVVLDLGCGTGAFAIPASRYCTKVYAADVSAPMLGLLRQKVAEQKIENIETFAAGFLTFPTLPEPVDAVVSSLALHHLPDFWKVVALKRIADALKPGGVFYLSDVVFHFPVETWREGTQAVLDAMESSAGGEANAHIAREYSAFDWFLEAAFERTGLTVEQTIDDAAFIRVYVCRKK